MRDNRSTPFVIFIAQVLCTGCSGELDQPPAPAFTPETKDWQHYGGGLDGARLAISNKLTPESVANLKPAWQYRTGDGTNDPKYFGSKSSFKSTPVFFRERLIFSTGFNRVIAIDPATGQEVWRFDPVVNFAVKYSEMFTSRGVAAWSDPDTDSNVPCAHRIFLGTLDARLAAIDADTGLLCAGFGRKGYVDLTKGIRGVRTGEYSVTSPPTIVNGVVVVGSSIGDNGGARLEQGAVRAFDARSGKQRWRFEPLTEESMSLGSDSSENSNSVSTGAANVWSVMAADAKRDLVFLPTTSPSPDFYGGKRPGDNRNANSVVALKATTGELIWAYQLVRHDLWDYDIASQPLLIDLQINGQTRPALVQATKMGFVFVLDRETGESLHPVADSPVPASNVPGEQSARKQRFPSIQLHSTKKEAFKLWDEDPEHVAVCEQMLDGVKYDGIFTPPSLQGSLLFPGNPGGVNWGSMAANEATGIGLVAVNRWPTVVKLVPRQDFSEDKANGTLNGVKAQFTDQSGTPYGMARFELFNRQSGLPCQQGPWSTLVAIDLAAATVLWERPLGIAPGIEPSSAASMWGYFAKGGPMLTTGDVAFIATPYDYTLWAFDSRTGDVLWQSKLPAEPESTPMSYEVAGEQYVVITAGGRSRSGAEQGDYVIAFKLDRT